MFFVLPLFYMKTNAALQKIVSCVLVILPMLTLVRAQAPAHTGKFTPVLDENINGFYEYLPRNYATDTETKYPLLVFFHANGETGSTPDYATLDRIKTWGTPKLIDQGGFPDSFYVGGQWFKFIVISPQIKDGSSWTQGVENPVKNATADAVVDYAKSAYRVDLTRIYMCGMSLGGGITLAYAGSSAAAANKLAAVVAACGTEELTAGNGNTIAAANLPVLATHNKDDATVPYTRTDNNIALINAYVPPIAPAPKVVEWGDGDHNVWSRTYEDIYPGITSQGLNGNLRDTLGVNVYEWLLQFARSNVTLPVTWQSFTVKPVKGAAELRWTITHPINTLSYTVEKSSDAIAWTALAVLPAQTNAGPAEQYLYTDPATVPYTCFYRIRQTDQDGAFHYSAVQKFIGPGNGLLLKIFPNPFQDHVLLQYTVTTQKNIHIKLVDAAGRIFLKKQYSIVRQ